MDVEKTIEFLLRSHGQLEATQARQQEMMGTLTESQHTLTNSLHELAGVVRELAVAQMRTDERVHELALLQKEHAEAQKQTRENIDALVRVVDELIRRDGRH